MAADVWPALDAIVFEAVENLTASQVLKFLKSSRAARRDLPIFLLSQNKDPQFVVDSFRAGANDCFLHPYLATELATAIGRVVNGPGRTPQLLGESSAIRTVKTLTERVANTESTILITGETGTGKELVAESIHGNSPRRSGPFVCVNCAAIPEGLFESELFGWERGAFTGATIRSSGKLCSANGGVLFLDEVGDLSLQGQTKLLRAIESREVYPVGGSQKQKLDIRIVAATNHNLDQRAREGHFRTDLFYRLNVIQIHVAPLRERKADIPILLKHFLGHYNRAWGQRVEAFSDSALEALRNHDWPGNVRELRNVVEAAYVNASSRTITPADLPRQILPGMGDTPGDEKQRLADILFQTNWNVSKAAERLRWSRMTVYRKLARYNMRRKENLPCSAASA